MTRGGRHRAWRPSACLPGALLIVCALLGSGCREVVTVEQGLTGIDLNVVFPESASLDQLLVRGRIGQLEAFAPGYTPDPPRPLEPAGESIVILLPDSLGGETVVLRVDGLLTRTISLSGQQEVTLETGTLVQKTVALGDAARCGDGEIRPPIEECDDANTTTGDGCSDWCLVEPEHFCEGEPSSCARGCLIDGDAVAAGERQPGAPCLACQPSVDAAAWTRLPDDTECDDGTFCNGVDLCLAGRCEATPPPCDDDHPTCDEAARSCRCTPTSCDDGLFCTGAESCGGDDRCAVGAAPVCAPPTPICSEIYLDCVACEQDADCVDPANPSCAGGLCTPCSTCPCPAGEHDGGDGACVPEGSCSAGFARAYADGDGDGYGDGPLSDDCLATPPPTGFAAVDGDCDDADPGAFPTNVEGPFGHASCGDGGDNDCDELTDGSDDGCAPSMPVPAAVAFDGSAGLTRAGDYDGLVDGGAATLSVWLRRAPDSLGSRFCLAAGSASAASSAYYWRVTVNGTVILLAYDPTGAPVLELRSAVPIADSKWHHLLVSFDLASPTRQHLYLDDQDVLDSRVFVSGASIDLTSGQHGVLAEGDGQQSLVGDAAELWLDFGAYFDLGEVEARRLFITAHMQPADLGATGEAPAGRPPTVYLAGDVDTFAANRGGGGALVLTNALAPATSDPWSGVTGLGCGSAGDSSTALLLHSSEQTGSQTFVDSSAAAAAVVTRFTVQHVAIKERFCESSIRFESVGDALVVAHHPDQALGSGDFTVDLWALFDALPVNATLLAQDDHNAALADRAWRLEYGAAEISFVHFDDLGEYADLAAAWTPELNRWYHLAAQRRDDLFTLFVDGAVAASRTYTHALNDSPLPVTVGAQAVGAGFQRFFFGHLDEVRISRGVARWPDDGFVPPDAAY